MSLTTNGPCTRRRFLGGGATGLAAAAVTAMPWLGVLEQKSQAAIPTAQAGIGALPELMQRDNVEFLALQPTASTGVATVAQCLDDQWVPRDLLRQMIETGSALTDSGVQQQREPFIRAEYIRALVNASRLVCNRAYLYNNPVVYRDYLEPGKERDAFKSLLATGAIVPYLYRERSPVDVPEFTHAQQSFPAWQRVCEETRVNCMRLSWDDDENGALCKQRLALRFHTFCTSAHDLSAERFARDVGRTGDAASELKKRLTGIAAKAVEFEGRFGKPVTREQLYKEFVTSGDPAEGRYDRAKPFAAAVKELIDLSYNTALPDALWCYSLTPRNSMPRTALQEVDRASAQASRQSDEILRLLRDTAFALVQEGQYLASFRWLTLEDVLAARGTDEWARYQHDLSSLLGDTGRFSDPAAGAPAVYLSYTLLARRITQLAKKRTRATWQPIVEVEMNFLGETASLIWSKVDPHKATYSGLKALSTGAGQTATAVAPLVMRFLIRNGSDIAGELDLVWSTHLLWGELAGGMEEWRQLNAKLKESAGARLADATPANRPTINYRPSSQ
jgi:hypothetical protein